MPDQHQGEGEDPRVTSRRGRWLLLGYGVAVYALSLGALAYLARLIWRMRAPGAHEPSPWSARATLANAALLGLFALQHSVMARSGFKGWLQRWVPPEAERSTYCLATSLAIAALVWRWTPMPGLVWHFDGPGVIWTLRLLGLAGVGMVASAASSMSHLELMGMKQPLRVFRGAPERPAQFREPGLYRWMRHPIYTGTLLFLWATPVMTQGHLMLSGLLSAYILFGTRLEEQDLARTLGPAYEDYQRRVGRFLPR